jgi:soluble lytic murein transglycosylase-like protein
MKKMTIIIIFLNIFLNLTPGWHEYDRIIIEPTKSLNEIIYEQSGIAIPSAIDPYHVWLMYEQSSKLNISPRILFRVIYQESKYNPNAKSSKGAEGYMQVMPTTWNEMVRELGWPKHTKKTPERNIIVGTEYLAKQYQYWVEKVDGEELAWIYALASYNAGTGKVIKYNGIPPYRETQEYLTFINQ